jgi:hypothetical protein
MSPTSKFKEGLKKLFLFSNKNPSILLTEMATLESKCISQFDLLKGINETARGITSGSTAAP